MNEEEILEKINKLKLRVTEIVQTIQKLKKQLEKAEIPLEDFRSNKEILEQELREILKQIAQVKQKTEVKPKEVVEEPSQTNETIPIKLPTRERDPVNIEEKTPDPVKKTSQLIDKEISLAQQADDLMYYFQTDFIDSITNANIYLSITVDDHFVIGIDYDDYPQKPKLAIPPEIIKLYEDDIEKFVSEIPSYANWNVKYPKKIFELITEIETILINKFQADVITIEQKSVEYVEKLRKSIDTALKRAQQAASNKDYQKAIDIYYLIIEKAQFINDYVNIERYAEELNELIRKKGS